MNAFSFTNGIDRPVVTDIQKNIENKYGVNIILPNDSDTYINLVSCMAVIDRNLSRLPDGIIKEITSSYLKRDIKTNIIINKAEYNSMKMPADYNMTDSSADITINILSNNLYGTSDVVSSDGIMHELGHFVCDYLFDNYSYDALEKEFDSINNGYEYGTWGNGYNYVFVNKNSATNLNNDISDLIWYAEAHPEKLRNINLGKEEIIHKKIEFLASIFDKTFESVTDDMKLWVDATPNDLDEWAEDTIKSMEKEGLIPKEFEGKYEPYISKEDFYILALNIIKTNIGEDKFYEYFNILKPEKSFNIDPINGEIIVNDDISNVFYNSYLYNNKEGIYEAYKIGLINDFDEVNFDPEAFITRLEVAKISAFICEKFEIDITKYNEVDFDDLSSVLDIEKPYINFAVSKGILMGDGNKLMPYEYCTYQEAYIMMSRVNDILPNQ